MYSSGSGVTVHILEPGCFKTGILPDPDHWRNVVEDKLNGAPQIVRCSYDDNFIDTMTKQLRKMLDTASPDIYKVVDAYKHAITARFPKARYVVGTDANIVFRLLWSVPEWLSDYMVYRMSKVD